MKIFKHRNIMGVIYGLVLAIPFLSILARSAYVTCNKNAYQSYSGINGYDIEYYNETNDVNSDEDLIINNIYKLDLSFNMPSTSGYNYLVDVSRIYLLDNTSNQMLYDYIPDSNSNFITIAVNNNNHFIYLISNPDGRYSGIGDLSNLNLTFYVVFRNLSINSTLTYQNFSKSDFLDIKGIIISNEGTLDNAFEYSLSEFVDDNHFGNLNFFEWFSSLFLDANHNNNALYIHFINWYMNYALYVSCAYILFLVIMWFINFSRRILERGMNYDW